MDPGIEFLLNGKPCDTIEFRVLATPPKAVLRSRIIIQVLNFKCRDCQEYPKNFCEQKKNEEGKKATMKNENLGNSISFMVDALITDEREYHEIESELIDAALRIAQIAWNAEVRGEVVAAPCEPVLRSEIRVDDAVWERLIRRTSPELVNLMRKRKQIFFPDDTRLIRRCFCNVFGTISVEEENEDGTIHVGQ